MPRLLFIETSTALCSTALAEDGRIICSRQSDTPRAHASQTAVFVKEMLDECGLKATDLDAVAVGMGPGSYTGLRVGVSTAKGICFGAGVPLIAVSTLDILAWQAIDGGMLPEGCTAILPMVDARRMEVFTAPFSPTGERLGEIAPVVLDGTSFADLFASGPVLVIGDAAEKFSGIVEGPNPTVSVFGARPWRTCPPPDRGRGTGPDGDKWSETTQETLGGAGVKDGSAGRTEFRQGLDSDTPSADGHIFVQTCPEAAAMLTPVLRKYAKKEFEDVAYFEPFYLKQFIATTPKKLF